MIALSVIIAAIAAFACGFAVGRAPFVPAFYQAHDEKLPTATVLLERVRDRRADISGVLRRS